MKSLERGREVDREGRKRGKVKRSELQIKFDCNYDSEWHQQMS